MQTGENAGTWGNNTNFNLGTLLEQAISSYVTQAMVTGTTTALSITDFTDAGGNTTPGTIFSAGTTSPLNPVSARNMYIELTGGGGASTVLQLPTKRKIYYIYNNTNGNVVIKTLSQVTGITIPTGKKYALACNGADIIRADSATYAVSVASSNGFTGTSDGADNPTLTLSTSQTGFLLGSSGALVGSTTLYQSGNYIGIGAASPATKLHISGFTTADTLPDIRVVRTGSLVNAVGQAPCIRLENTDIDGSYVTIQGTGSNFQVYTYSTTYGSNLRLQINALGNLGLGVAPSTVTGGTGTRSFQLRQGTNNAGIIVTDPTFGMGCGDNCYFDNGLWKYFNSAAASAYTQTNGVHTWYTVGAGTGGNSINGTGSWNTAKMTLSAAGGLSVGTATDPGVGAIYATGNITAYYSDDRLKTRKGNIENALSKVLSLDGFHYEANETAQALGYKAKPEVGLSAQQVQAVLPEVVVPAPIDEQYLTVHYERLIPLLVEAIKEQNKKIEALEARLNGMR